MPTGTERTAVLVIRVWLGGDDDGLIARLTQVNDLGSSDVVVGTASTAEGVVAAVRDWLSGVQV
jgi:hypothetical protein